MVTDLKELSRSRSKVYLDGVFAFVLYKGELRKYQIQPGSELSEEAEQEILTVLLPKRAKLRCMNLLLSREYTERQLRDKLEQGFYPQPVVDEALEYVKSFRYVDDRRYAAHFIECHLADRSRQRIRMDLLRRGIAGGIIEEELSAAAEDELNPKEGELLARLLEKKHYSAEMTMQEKQKIFSHLLRKGFQSEDIRRAMRECGDKQDMLDITLFSV